MLLRYRRQFLLSREALPGLEHWQVIVLSNSNYLYVHPDLPITHKTFRGTELVLLGYLFDASACSKNNSDILEDIGNNLETFDAFVEALSFYAGRYVLILLRENYYHLLQDALGLREVYYCIRPNRIICGSQPNLISKYSNPYLRLTKNASIQHFNTYERIRVRDGRLWVGDKTLFEEIRHLLPNHSLDIPALRPKRYWPRRKLERKDFREVVSYASNFLQGILKAASYRYELMMAVTAGTDSRTLLAASKNLKDEIYFFINQHKGLRDSHPDIRIPSTIFNKIHIPFHIHKIIGDVDNDFKEIFLSNTFMSSEKLTAAVFNVYYKHHSTKLNLQCIGEIGRDFYGGIPRKLDGFYLARSMKYRSSPYAVTQCQEWLNQAYPIARATRVSIMTLLLWEQLLGNWGSVGHSESDIAIETFNPLDCHHLYETLLSVDPMLMKGQQSIVFREMIKMMWPELLEYPINPPYGPSDEIKHFFNSLGLFSPAKSLLYKLDRFKFYLLYR